MVELMAAKFAELWRRRMMERPRDDAQLKPRLTAAGKRKPRYAGFSDFSRVYQRQIRRGPQGVGRNQQRRPHAPQLRRQPPQGPRCQPSPQPPATCVINDCCSNGKSEAGNAPASKEISATIQPAAIADGFKNMEESPRFTAPRRISFAWPCKSRQEHVPKELLDFFDQNMLQLFKSARFLIDQMIHP